MFLQVVLALAIAAAFAFGIACKFLLEQGKAGQQMAETQLAAAAKAIESLKDDKTRLMLVKAAELASVRREAADKVRDLEREIFELETEALARKKYNICHQCERSKGEPQQAQSNGQRGRLRNIVEG